MMGNADGEENEAPVHQVTVSAFRIARHEVTNYQFAAYLNEALAAGEAAISGDTSVVAVGGEYDGLELIKYTAKKAKQNECWITYSGGMFTAIAGKENWPVVFVTWYGAASYAAHYEWRLPYEAEWECAASLAGTVPYGTDTGQADSLNLNMNFNAFVGHPVAVGSYGPQPVRPSSICPATYMNIARTTMANTQTAPRSIPTDRKQAMSTFARAAEWNSCALSTMVTARINQDYPGHKGPWKRLPGGRGPGIEVQALSICRTISAKSAPGYSQTLRAHRWPVRGTRCRRMWSGRSSPGCEYQISGDDPI